MKHSPFFLVGFLIAAVIVASLARGERTANANTTAFSVPTGLAVSGVGPNFIRFHWTPGAENFWFCLDTAYSLDELFNFYGSWTNYHCGTTNSVVEVHGLRCGTVHYWRVYAVGPDVSGHSQAVFTSTTGCSFAPPHSPRSSPISATAMRFQWDASIDNQWFCVDVALNQDDLLNFRGSWRNFGCGMTNTVLEVFGFGCGTHYWRVYAQGTNTGGHSQVATFNLADCNFSVPTNLRPEALSGTSIRFQWDRGGDNRWFCLDTALSSADLNSFSGSWRNHHCETTSTSVDVTGLACGTIYFWRIYASGTARDGHSAEAQARTMNC